VSKTLREIAALVGGTIVGEADTLVAGASGLEDAAQGDILFVENRRYADRAAASQASAALVPPGVVVPNKPCITVEDPRAAFLKVLALFQPRERLPQGIAETARIGQNVTLGEGVAIGDYCCIGDNVVIGDGVVLFPMVYVGDNVTIGPGSVIYPQVTVYRDVTIGARVRIHSGSVIGADGFGYVFIEGRHVKVPHIGTVTIEDDVEIGACACVDRAKTAATVVGRGTKIDNLVQVAHNCRLGNHCILAGQVGLAGSVSLGDYVVLGGQVGVNGHTHIGSGSQVAAQSGVMSDLEPGSVVSGYPAHEHRRALRETAAVRQLPELLKTVRSLEQRIQELERALGARPSSESA